MKRVLVIGTGGTIASQSTDRGLAPALSAEMLLSYVPQVASFAKIDATDLMNIDSTNVVPADWLAMASCIEKNYADYDGFVVCHGTDTMAYTAAALSYLVQRSPKPVVVTGAQRPIDLDVTDARQNLADAIRFAATPGAADVTLVFDGKVVAGTRARKERTHSFNAFTSMNFPYLATIQNDRVIFYVPDAGKSDGPIFYRNLDAKVGLVKLVPGIHAGMLAYACETNDAVVVESFGVGGLPTNSCIDAPEILSKACAAGKTVVMTTQVPLEGSNMSVYEVGRAIVETPGMLEAFDMTIESSLVKLMWILSLTRDQDEIRELFHTTINHDTLYV